MRKRVLKYYHEIKDQYSSKEFYSMVIHISDEFEIDPVQVEQWITEDIEENTV